MYLPNEPEQKKAAGNQLLFAYVFLKSYNDFFAR